jgi:hypothetical protein
MRSKVATTAIAAVALLGVAAPTAAASTLKGAPSAYTFGEGVVSADGSTRFVTLQAGEKTTVMAISTDGGEVTGHSTTAGTYTVPAIAIDGTASGISADGETLALISPRATFAQQTTDLQLYEARKLRKGPENITLKGDFGFDALSPDGETLYLIEYTDPRDPGAYQVRSYDVTSGQLDPDPILDSEEEPGEMRGFPQTRLTSPDGRWEYTLYDGGEHPFIHALDVVDGVTLCIDLDMIHARQTFGATLAMNADESAVELTDRKGELRAVVDTESHTAHEPGEEPDPGPAAAPAEPEDSKLEAAGIAAGGLVLMALAAVGIRRMRK